MKRLERAPWVALTGRYVLCCHCRYAECVGEDGFCCAHPVEAVTDRADSYGMEPLDDCWGFRLERGDTVDAAAARVQEWRAKEREGRS